MGIKDRIKFIARSYLNSFKDGSRTSRRAPDPDIQFEDDDDAATMSEDDFERQWAEFQKEQAERARDQKPEWQQEGPPPRRPSGERTLEQCYQNLECPVGADLKTVRTHFRRLMKKYHPDLHAANKRNQEAANRISQIITECYQQLEKHLESKGQR